MENSVTPGPVGAGSDGAGAHHVEALMANTGIETRWGGHSALYRRPSEDFIQMPEQGLFTGTKTTTATEALYAIWLQRESTPPATNRGSIEPSPDGSGHKSEAPRSWSPSSGPRSCVRT